MDASTLLTIAALILGYFFLGGLTIGIYHRMLEDNPRDIEVLLDHALEVFLGWPLFLPIIIAIALIYHIFPSKNTLSK